MIRTTDHAEDLPPHRKIKFWDFPGEERQEVLRGVFHDAIATIEDERESVKFHTDAPADFMHGHRALPSGFYEGPVFFVSGWNPEAKQVDIHLYLPNSSIVQLEAMPQDGARKRTALTHGIAWAWIVRVRRCC